MKNLQEVTQILYELDPMNTACVENGLKDEYISEAKLIINNNNVKAVFDYQFWTGCLTDDQIQQIQAAIE